MKQRILLLDCAMGTMIQSYDLTDEDYRGERFADHPGELKGNNDLLTLTQPKIIRDIHEASLEAGSDIVETNTFSSTSIAQADYKMEDLAYELNYEAARVARAAADAYSEQTPDRPRFVAGAIGPTNRTASLSPDVNNPGFRNVTFDELAEAYKEAAKGLVEGGADLLLVETIFDTLNAKAAIFGIKDYLDEEASGRADHDLRHHHRRERPHALRSGNGGVLELRPSRRADQRRPELRPGLRRIAAVHRGALRHRRDARERLPECRASERVRRVRREPRVHGGTRSGEWAANGWLNIVGGCCGTTPEHIEAIAEAVSGSSTA